MSLRANSGEFHHQKEILLPAEITTQHKYFHIQDEASRLMLKVGGVMLVTFERQ